MVSLYIISSAKQNNNDNNRDISIWSHERHIFQVTIYPVFR